MPPKPRDHVDDTLDFYHRLLADLLTASREPGHLKLEPEEKANWRRRIQMTTEAWAVLNEARVFAFDPQVYRHIYIEADRYTTEVMCGIEYSTDEQAEVPMEEAKHLLETIMWQCKHVTFPETWPFETIYLGFGQGLHVSAADFDVRREHYSKALNDELTAAFVRGYLITTKNGGNVWEMVEYETRHENNAVVPEQMLTHGNWQRSYSLVPWMTQGMNRLLSSYRKFIEEQNYTTTQKYDRGKQAKKLKSFFMPRPYYVVKLTNKIIEEEDRKPGNAPHYRFNYRFDVRGHERVKVRRGRLPLDAKLDAKLRKRGYQIFLNQITDEFIRKLFERHISPKSPDEWVAVLSTWVDAYQKGPENAPYIPAIRTPIRGKSE